jgi:hypothetical protein
MNDNPPIKSMSLRYRECVERICNVINESGMPAFLAAHMLDDISREAHRQADVEYQRDLENYNHQLAQASNDKEA